MDGRISGLGSFLRGVLDAPVRHNASALAGRLRRRRYRTRCLIDTAVVITSPADFSAGSGSALYHGAYVLNGPGTVRLGDRSHLGAMCYVNVLHGTLTIGNDVAVGPHTSIIVYSNHYERGGLVTEVRRQEDIHIGDNVFIGANCTILPGARIQDNVIIGAGSVVRGTLVTDTIYAGVPCRPVRRGWFQRPPAATEDPTV